MVRMGQYHRKPLFTSESRAYSIALCSDLGPTAYCVDIEPHAPYMYEWSNENPSAGPYVRIMRYGSTTLKSAVGAGSARRRVKDTPYRLAARLSSIAVSLRSPTGGHEGRVVATGCFSSTRFRAGLESGSLLTEALPPRGRRSAPAAMVISYLDAPHAGLVATNFTAASVPSGFEK